MPIGVDGSTSSVPNLPEPGGGVEGAETRRMEVAQPVKDDLEKLGVRDLSQLTAEEKMTLNRLAKEYFILNTAESGEPQLIPPDSALADASEGSTLTKQAADYFSALQAVVKRLTQEPPLTSESPGSAAVFGSVSAGTAISREYDPAVIQEMAAEFVAKARAGAKKLIAAGEGGGGPQGPNQALAGTSVTSFDIISLELVKLLSNMAGQDALLGIKLREAVREMVRREQDAIEKQGQLEKDQYNDIATAKLTSAITAGVTGVVAIGAHAYVERSGTNRGMSEERIKMRTDRMHTGIQTVQTMTSQGTDAATNFIQASYATDIKNEESKRVFFQNYGQSQSGAREDQLRKVGDSRQQIDSVLQKKDQFDSSSRRININPHQAT